MMEGGVFAAVYRDTYGNEPTVDARLGYTAARLIDNTVRAVAGDVENREALFAALSLAD